MQSKSNDNRGGVAIRSQIQIPALAASDPAAATACCVLLSGGFDSASILASILESRVSVRSLFVDYGQPARGEERAAASAIAAYYGVSHSEVSIAGLFCGDGEIPGRNALLAVLALIAAPSSATIALGIHAGSPYWDCAGEFLELMQRLADGYAAGAIQIAAPLLDFSKADVYVLGRGLGVPEELTYSCERGGSPCGTCASCRDRDANARS